jgi:hypothetical protein
MKLALFASIVCLLVPIQEPERITFTEPYIGIQFSHPADWKVTKKAKDRTYLSVPVPGSSEPAELQIVHTQYHADKDLFQTVQLRINEQLKREVVRQWEQDVLGVPILFTRINYNQGGVARTTLTGLYYTRTPLKMLVRLDSREADYDNVAYVLMQALETLKMADGSTPRPDDPAVTLETVPIKAPPIVAPPRVIDGGKTETAVVKPGGSAAITVSERPLKLLFAEGWVADKVEGNNLTLTHPELSRPINVQVFTTLDSEPSRTALYKASSKSLSRYTKVDSREDKEKVKNKAGAVIATVWRIGKTSEGDLAEFHGAGDAGEYYFMLNYEQTDMAAYKSDRKLIESLVDLLTIEPAP